MARHDLENELDERQTTDNPGIDPAVLAKVGGSAVDAYGTSLGAAATGVLADVDLDEARQRLRDAQVALAALGYRVSNSDEPGAGIDGVWGPLTRDAVRQYQCDHDMDEVGQLDGETYESLLNAYEEGISVRAAGTPDSAFAPSQADQPVSASDLALEGGVALEDSLGLDDDEDGLLEEVSLMP